MGKKRRQQQKQLETTNLKGYAIRVANRQVYYFNNLGILSAISIDDVRGFELQGLKQNGYGPLTVELNFIVYGLSNKNAFKSAAASAQLGCTMEEFYEMAYQECVRMSTKPHQPKSKKKSRRFVLQVCDPKVVHKKHGMRITVKFIINSNYTERDPIEESIQRMNELIAEAKNKLATLDEFKGIPYDQLPNSTGVSISRGSFTVEFQV